uniref:CCR4-Not complex component Not N-terminal domain-containing protein n=1 Tax=Setaria italica TaxID=4555 RepID=K4A6G9_SETIT
MGASRKLQGEIDRVLKKVQEGVDVFDSIWNKVYDTENANQKEKFEADLKKEIKKLQRYRDQIKTWIQSSEIKDKKALMDARKQIEREMERFKVCEKETKTKAFSKEGLGQQPKTDPKEKAKAETRDWLNTVVSDLESQIDNFEAEVEGLSIKKGKQRPPRLVHLEKSITRHKAHIKKLESILRLLDNDELSPEQVNDVKDFLEDYVERNQEDFDEFSDVEDLYSTLPMEKVEALEDMVSLAPSSLVKGVASVSTSAVLSTKTSSVATSSTQPTVSTTTSQSTSQDQTEETASQESNPESMPQTPPSKGGNLGPSVPVVPIAISTGSVPVSVPAETINSPVRPTVPTTAAAILSSATPRSAPESTPVVTSIPANLSGTLKDDDSMSFPPRRPSPAITEIGIGRGIARGVTSQTLGTAPISIGPVPGNGSLVSPLGNKVQPQQLPRTNDAISSDSASTNENPILGGRVFSPPVVSGVQWRPQTAAAFQNQSETSQFRGRPEISADQREKYLQRLQQVQQQQGSLLNVPHIAGINQKQFPTQQPNPLLQQFNSQSSSISSQVNLGLGAQGSDAGHVKSEEQQQSLAEDVGVESAATTGANKQTSEDDTKIPYPNPSAPATENTQLPRDTDLSPGQPLQPGMSSSAVGVIGRRSVSDLGAIGDNLTGTSASSGHDQLYNLQMLEAAFHRLPQPKDSERAKNYVPVWVFE